MSFGLDPACRARPDFVSHLSQINSQQLFTIFLSSSLTSMSQEHLRSHSRRADWSLGRVKWDRTRDGHMETSDPCVDVQATHAGDPQTEERRPGFGPGGPRSPHQVVTKCMLLGNHFSV